ncbi:MAG: ATP-binding cassette domain-containing protein [Deltaproteobacteria bacterium]|nr:ATP-binding cassette domain-containing protein [Deltaproteobacteria bacterium]
MTEDTKKIIYSMGKNKCSKIFPCPIFYGAKIGVLGLNGSGKSSLLKIMAGIYAEFSGETILSKGFIVGFTNLPLFLKKP